MLALLISCAIAASLLVELGLAVIRDVLEGVDATEEDERQMNEAFKSTSGRVW